MNPQRLNRSALSSLRRPRIQLRLAALQTLRLSSYRYLLLTTALNMMAREARLMAQAWLILTLTNSDVWVGIVVGLPALLAAATAPLGGVLADRLERRRMLMVVRFALAAIALVTALLVVSDRIQVWQLLVLAFLIALLDVSGLTAGQTMIMDSVPSEELFGANALYSAANNLALVMGPALAGLILAQGGVAYAFALSAVMYIGSALAASRIRVEQRKRGKAITMTSVKADLMGGLRFVRQTPALQWLLLLGFTAMAVGVWSALVPRYAKDVLETGATGYGAILSARGAGGLVGVVMLLVAGRIQRLAVVLVICYLGFTILVIGFALSNSMLVAVAIAFGLGIIFIWYPSTLRTGFQFSATDAIRGRVMSLFSLLGQLLTFGWLVGGALSAWFGPQLAMIIVAVLGAAVHILAYMYSSDLRALGRS